MPLPRTSPLLLAAAAILCTSCNQASPPPASQPAIAPLPAPAPAAAPRPERVLELGRSVEGRPIHLHLFGDAPRPTLVLGAIHGSEPTSETVARRLLEHLRQHPDTLPRGAAVAIVPVANPDGLARRLRTNKNLIDINRNFPAANWAKRPRRGRSFGGDAAASEPETQAILAAFDRLRPARVISIHSMDQPCNNYDGPARPLAELMHRHNRYPVKDNIGYPTPGSLGTWAGTDHHIPIVTLELPRKLPGDPAWEQNRAALLAVIAEGASPGATDAR